MVNSNKSLYTEYDHHDPDFDLEQWIEEQEKENRKIMLNLVKSYFPKNNYTISYRTLTVEVK